MRFPLGFISVAFAAACFDLAAGACGFNQLPVNELISGAFSTTARTGLRFVPAASSLRPYALALEQRTRAHILYLVIHPAAHLKN